MAVKSMSPTGGKYASRGSNTEGPNSAGLRSSGGVKRQLPDGGAGTKAPNKGNIKVIGLMNSSTHHTTYGKGKTTSE